MTNLVTEPTRMRFDELRRRGAAFGPWRLLRPSNGLIGRMKLCRSYGLLAWHSKKNERAAGEPKGRGRFLVAL
jgi:hypothetical protein